MGPVYNWHMRMSAKQNYLGLERKSVRKQGSSTHLGYKGPRHSLPTEEQLKSQKDEKVEYSNAGEMVPHLSEGHRAPPTPCNETVKQKW